MNEILSLHRYFLHFLLPSFKKHFWSLGKEAFNTYLSHSYHGEGTILTQTRQSKAKFQWHFPTKVSKHIGVKTFQTLHLRLHLQIFETLFHSQFHQSKKLYILDNLGTTSKILFSHIMQNQTKVHVLQGRPLHLGFSKAQLILKYVIVTFFSEVWGNRAKPFMNLLKILLLSHPKFQ